ncbi:MAG TPA: phenylalanine--tRNA ligase subunit beta, partial [Terriglobales bacterium]
RFSSLPPVALANPLSEETPLLRNSLAPGMLEMIAHNLNRGTTDVQLFEAGRIFIAQGDPAQLQVREKKALCLGATGNAVPGGIQTQPRAFSFYDLKGAVEEIAGSFSSQSLSFESPAATYYHPGGSALIKMEGKTVGQLGQIHPALISERKLRQEIFVAELDLGLLLQFAMRGPRYTRLSRFPAVERDFSFVLGNQVVFAQIAQAVRQLQIAELRSIAPREIFRGGAVPEGKYSLLLSASFQSTERTLRDDEVALWSNQIIQAVAALGGTLRSS